MYSSQILYMTCAKSFGRSKQWPRNWWQIARGGCQWQWYLLDQIHYVSPQHLRMIVAYVPLVDAEKLRSQHHGFPRSVNQAAQWVPPGRRWFSAWYTMGIHGDPRCFQWNRESKTRHYIFWSPSQTVPDIPCRIGLSVSNKPNSYSLLKLIYPIEIVQEHHKVFFLS